MKEKEESKKQKMRRKRTWKKLFCSLPLPSLSACTASSCCTCERMSFGLSRHSKRMRKKLGQEFEEVKQNMHHNARTLEQTKRRERKIKWEGEVKLGQKSRMRTLKPNKRNRVSKKIEVNPKTTRIRNDQRANKANNGRVGKQTLRCVKMAVLR